MQNAFDLVVVGTGFASTFFLHQYLRDAPARARVLVLERGYNFLQRDRRRQLAGDAVKNPNPEPHEVYVNNNQDKHWAFSIGFGGSSNCWFGCTPRFMPSDFEMQSRYGVAVDWPLRYEDLNPYYAEVERLMNIAGPDQTPFPREGKYPLPPHRFSTVDEILHKEYGPLYISQPTARPSRAVDGRSACCANAVCRVCPVDAKFTIENSGMAVYEHPRVTTVFGAYVTHLDVVNDRATGVSFLNEGVEHVAKADIVALGANAIFNAAILLNSGDRNRHTGRGLGEQIGLDVVVYLDKLANVGGSSWVTANGYMLYDGDHRREYAACLIESNHAPYVRLEKGKWRDVAVFRMIFDDLPQDKNHVSVEADPLKPHVFFGTHSAYAYAGIERMKGKLASVLSPLPVERIEFREPFKTEAHILGTTRMSVDEESGVVDKNLIHHRYRNVFVLGSGSFATFTPANPTLTLCALSLMAAKAI